MARSKINDIVTDLQSDSGSVLWSIVQGEQLEFPITLNFIENTSVGYVFEAVVMEGLNILNQTEKPISARPSGINTQLDVWVPPWRGDWNSLANPSSTTEYNRDDLIKYNGKYYILLTGTAYISTTVPSSDGNWVEYTPNKVYVRFPSTLSTTWNNTAVPTSDSNIYGFFELRVTEPNGGRFTRTWKPMRGLVEILYSPTALVN